MVTQVGDFAEAAVTYVAPAEKERGESDVVQNSTDMFGNMGRRLRESGKLVKYCMQMTSGGQGVGQRFKEKKMFYAL